MLDNAFYPHTSQPPFIALIGCDGAGKSTMTQELAHLLGQDYPTSFCYLGLGSGDLGRRIKQWPVIGPRVEKMLSARALKTRTPGEKIPGVVTALVVFCFSLLRFYRFQKAMLARSHGQLIVADRYPQAEIPGWCDGPGLSAASTDNRFINWLARIEKRLYEHMAAVHPTVIIFLDVDIRTALNRKPDHDPALLATKIEKTRKLHFDGTPMERVDARQDYTTVRRSVLNIVRRYLHRHETQQNTRERQRAMHTSGDLHQIAT